MKKPEKLYHALCGEGLVSLLEGEIQGNSLKIIRSNRAGVFFSGKEEAVIRFATTSKFASRITLQLLYDSVSSYEELYNKAVKLPWERYIQKDTSFRIDAETKDNLQNSLFAKQRLKDAILDRLRNQKLPLPEIEPKSADITILLRSHTDRFSLELSLTGESLGRRGYRLFSGKAPVREPIAQAMLHFSGWYPGKLLVDPMCGSGTILIEAALRLKLTEEINRFHLQDSVSFLHLFPQHVFSKRSIEPPIPKKILGFDVDIEAIRMAKENAYEAGVEDFIEFEVGNFLERDWNFPEPGYLVTNPPYGERLGESKEELRELYFQMGKVWKNRFPGWTITVLAGDTSLLGKFGLTAKRELPIKHANLKAKIVSYDIRGLL